MKKHTHTYTSFLQIQSKHKRTKAKKNIHTYTHTHTRTQHTYTMPTHLLQFAWRKHWSRGSGQMGRTRDEGIHGHECSVWIISQHVNERARR